MENWKCYDKNIKVSNYGNVMINNKIKIPDGEVIKVWNSIKEATEELHIPQGNISKCCQGKIKRIGIYKWSYLIDKKV